MFCRREVDRGYSNVITIRVRQPAFTRNRDKLDAVVGGPDSYGWCLERLETVTVYDVVTIGNDIQTAG